MPIVGTVCGSMIQQQMLSVGFSGQYSIKIASAIGNGVINMILASAVYNGISTGLGLGTGASTGKITGPIVTGASLSNLIFLQMTSVGLVGEKSNKFANAVGKGIANHMAAASIVTGISTVVAIGNGTGFITGIIGTVMGSQILAMMASQGIIGQYVQKLSNAIGKGVAAAISASIVNTTITGVAIGVVGPGFPPIPSTGTDTGKIF